MPIVVGILIKAIGKKQSIMSKDIIYIIATKGHKTNSGKVRKIIHEIRMKGLIVNLIAPNNGYYIATNPQETDHYIQSLRTLEYSIMEIRKVLISQKPKL